MLTVIASMEHELATLRRRLESGCQATAPFPQANCDRAVDLQVIGVGEQAGAKVRSLLAKRYAPSNLEATTPDRLLLIGFAGAVDPALKSGDLVLAPRYYRPEFGRTPTHSTPLKATGEEGDRGDYVTADPAMLRHAVEAAGEIEQTAARVDSLTVDSLVTTPQAKEAVARTYPVGIVEMEDYWVASVARDAGVPFLSARVVLDAADQTIPPYLLGLSHSRVKASLMSAAMPWRIPTLIRLARQVAIAQRALARFALRFIAQANNGHLNLSYHGAAPSGVASIGGGPR